MHKCPNCGADTRPGDNFCLNCGNHLPAGTSSPMIGDSTLPEQNSWGVSPDRTEAASGNWDNPSDHTQAASGSWDNPSDHTQAASGSWDNPSDHTQAASGSWDAFSDQTIASTLSEPSAVEVNASASPVEPRLEEIEHPARFIIHDAKGEVLQEYLLAKKRLIIGRASECDISFSHDMLVSRSHAIISYEDGSYVLHDEGSANGTFVNTQQLEKRSNWTLRDGDKIAIGDQELTFLTATPTSPAREEQTMLIAPGTAGEDAGRDDEDATALGNDPLGTQTMDIGSQSGSTPATGEPIAESSAPIIPIQPEEEKVQDIPTPLVPVLASATIPAEAAISINSFASLSQPTLPEVASLLAASVALESQVKVLQQQLGAAHVAMHNHETDIIQTASQLRIAMRRLADRMDSTIAGIARSRGELDWDGLLHSLQETISNPRDIGNAMEFAHRAADVDKVFQRYQGVLNTLAECNSLLRGLIGEEKP